MSDALFGFDGTEPSQLRSDPSGRGGWSDAPELPPLTLPAIPGLGVTREAVAATLGEDPSWLVDQNSHLPSEHHPADPPSAPQSRVPSAHAPSAHAPAPLLPQAAPQLGGPPAVVAPDHSRSRVPAPVPPGKLAPPKPRSLFFRPPLAVRSRPPLLLSDLRRRVGRQGSALPLQLRSNGGAGVFFFIALIIFAILAYNIIAGIVESIIRLF